MDWIPRKMRRAQDSIKRNIVHIRRYRYLYGNFLHLNMGITEGTTFGIYAASSGCLGC